MSNNKKKTQQHEKRKKKYKSKVEARQSINGKPRYPLFELTSTEAGDPAFVRLIKDAIDNFSYATCDIAPLYLKMLHIMKLHDFHYAEAVLRKMIQLDEEKNDTNDSNRANFEASKLFHCVGDAIFRQIGHQLLSPYILWNEVNFTPIGRRFEVSFNSLLRERGSKGDAYYSRKRPTVEIEGKLLIVAFSIHAMERICSRLKGNRMTYIALGDAFSYFNDCRYFENAILYPDQLGFTFYDLCCGPHHVTHRYVADVYGYENIRLDGGNLYYRLGYCPAVIEHGFFKAKTFLYPGYKCTPEYGLLLNATMSHDKRNHLLHLTDAQETKYEEMLMRGEVAAVKWFHDNGIPQVIQTKMAILDVKAIRGGS